MIDVGGVEWPPAVRALLDASTALQRTASGRMALARAEPFVALGGAPGPELSRRDVEKALKRAWGKPPGRVLDDFDDAPVAVRGAAQVHRGVLDGAAVAIKVGRPGLAAAVRGDLSLLDALRPPLRSIFGAADLGALLREVREFASDELDLEHEASGQRAARRVLRDVDEVVVPAVFGEWCAEAVLVSEWMEGPTLEEALPDDPERCARALLGAHVAAARAGVLLSDPRPGHVVLRADGRVGLLGAGVQRPLPRDRAATALDAAEPLRADDAPVWTAVFVALGVLDAAGARAAHGLARAVLDAVALGPARLDEDEIQAVADRGMARVEDALALARVLTPAPVDVSVARTAAQLIVTLAHTGAELDWLREIAAVGPA